MDSSKRALIWIGFIFCFRLLSAQELAPIEKFTPENYAAGNQNWMISQGSNRFVYVANNEGLLEFNGAEWKLYPTPNKTILRSVAVIEDKIYTGCYMDFGYWERNAKGILEYTSLSQPIKNKIQNDEQFWRIINYDEWVIFQSLNNIYFYNTKSKKYTITNFDNIVTKVFKVENAIYLHVVNEGVYKIHEGKPILLIKAQEYKNDWVINIFSSEDALLLVTQTNGFYKYASQKLIKWEVESDLMLRATSIYSSIQLTDKSILLGTISQGIIQIDAKGTVINKFNQNNGLSNNTVLSLFEDKEQNIWAGLDNGINYINLNSPLKIFNDDYGNIGTVYASKVFEGFLYIGTNQGLYYKRVDVNEAYNFIQGTKGQVWALHIIDKKLFCGHDSGTFIIEKGAVNLITSIPGTWIFREVPFNNEIILQGQYDGISVLQKENGKWKFRNKLKGFDISSRFLEIDKDKTIWVNHEYKGVYKLMVDQDFRKITNVVLESSVSKGKNSSIGSFKNKLLYASQEGIFYFDRPTNKFVKDSSLSKIIEDETYESGKLIVDESNKLWIFTKSNAYYITPGQISETPLINKIPIPLSLRKSMTGYENIAKLSDNKFLIGKVDGYITLDLKKITSEKYKIELNSIVLKDLNTAIPLAQSLTEKGDYNYQENSFEFHFSVPEYEKHLVVDYQYKVEGFHDNWMSLGEINKVSLDNLPHGNYKLKVRAMVGNELTVNEINYPFKIQKPWFFSHVALLFYIVTFLILTVIIHRSYKRYYNLKHLEDLDKKKKELELSIMEKEQQMMQIKNDQLKFDIESKNRELAISTMSVIKKNELLNNIKKELQNTKSKDNNKPVLRLIDKNLNDADDWSFFEEAFNNADKNFMKKIKKIHPSLTPNDLRLCAYLRLNLSSKEIANLLNISTRSVEIKRYRLRKKMELAHNTSLVNYILEI